MMEFSFIGLLMILGLVFLRQWMSRPIFDHIFSPFPGYILLFGLYCLFGILNVSSTFDVSTLPIDSLWGIFFLGVFGFSLTSNSLFQNLINGGKVIPEALSSDRRNGSDYFYKSFNAPLLAIIWIISLSITLLLWVQNGVPLLSRNVDAARMAVASNGYLGTLAASIDVAALFCLIFIYSCENKKKDWRFLFAIIVISSFFVVAILSGSRSRIFKLLIPAFTARHFLKKPIAARNVVFGIPFGALIIGLLGFFRAQSRWGTYIDQGLPASVSHDLLSEILYFASIEFSTAIYGLANVVKLFPYYAPFTYGWLHIGPLLTPFQAKIPIPGNYFKQVMGGTWDGVGLAATFLAPMYAEFGLFGVFFLSVFYGLLIGWLYRRIRVPSNLRFYRVGTYAIFFYVMLSAMRSDFISFDLIWFMSLCKIFCFARIRPKISQRLDSE